MKKSVNIGSSLAPVIFSIILLVIWETVVEGGAVPKFILPSPRDMVISLFRNFPIMANHILVTLYEAFVGFSIAIVLALLLSILMDSVDIVKKALYPLLIVSQTIPTIALAPLFAIWFGFGSLPKIIIVILVCFFPIVVNLMDGMNSIDRDMLNLFRSMGANRIKTYTLLKFPASLPNFFSGLRIAATYSIMGAVVGEWLGGEAGLGVYMIRVKQSFAMDKLFAAILIIIVLSMLLFKAIAVIEKACTPWNRKEVD